MRVFIVEISQTKAAARFDIMYNHTKKAIDEDVAFLDNVDGQQT